ncbi:MAG TPA: DUF2065 domain-containing protein [Pararhizobium sp.]|nr:DUF2065 domain-containing protein [Pararhizobium sp.]
MSDFVIGLGLFFVIEGLIYALAPSALRTAAKQLPKIGDTQMRIAGVVAIAVGVAIVWLVKR